MNNGTIIKRTNLVSSTLTSRENINININNKPQQQQQQQQQQQSRKLQQISSCKCLFLVCVVVAVNFSVLSTLLKNNDITAGQGGVGNNGHRILPSQNNAYDYLPSKKYENNEHSTASKSISSSVISTEDKIRIPYYLKGKTQYQHQTKFNHKTTFQLIHDEVAKPVNESQRVWVLSDPVKSPTRNHESILLEYNDENEISKQIFVTVLGRYSRGVQWMDLKTGEQNIVETKGMDPDHRPLNDLNHVASVVVDSIDDDDDDDSSRKKKEIWLPCGFHNDLVGNEVSSNYVRIVDLETMQVRVGPKLPYSGGACGAATIEAIPGEPPLICAFGGTDGNHDKGEKYSDKYNRRRRRKKYYDFSSFINFSQRQTYHFFLFLIYQVYFCHMYHVTTD
jgi:hypothetical protein